MTIKIQQRDGTKRELRGAITGVVFDFPNRTVAIDVIGLKHPQIITDVITAVIEGVEE